MNDYQLDKIIGAIDNYTGALDLINDTLEKAFIKQLEEINNNLELIGNALDVIAQYYEMNGLLAADKLKK